MDEKKSAPTPDASRFPSNSKYTGITPSAPRPMQDKSTKKVETVAKGRAVQKKQTLSEKLSSTFLATDIHSVFRHIVFEVLVPAAKDTLYDIIHGSASMMLFGNRNGNRPGRPNGQGETRIYRDYGQYSNGRGASTTTRQPDGYSEQGNSSRNVLDDIVFTTKQEAEDVLDSLKKLIEEYGVASVMDLYNLAGVRSVFTQDKYGWFELNDRVSGIVRIREGWLIKLPRPIVID